MPKRIPFHIVYATSEDVSYPACELNSQGPAARGWRSQGPPPHELLLRLTSVAAVHKLQLLAHHQLIPSCVEVLVSGGLVSEGAATPCGATYTSVGKVTLQKPTPQARTRELRSAALPEPTMARFVKLRMSAPHPPANEDDQVALMAINVLGETLPPDPGSPLAPQPHLSPFDDLAFVMYVDNEIADLVRELDGRKRAAVGEERFEYARRLKSAGTALMAAGARIGRWRLRKRTAAARDDFELAKQLRDRIDEAMEAVKGDEGLKMLFEVEGPDPRNDTSMQQDYDFSHYLSPALTPAHALDPPALESAQDEDDEREEDICNGIEDVDGVKSPVQDLPVFDDTPAVEEVLEISLKYEETNRRENEKETDSPRRSVTPNAGGGGVVVRRRNKSAGPSTRSTYESYEDRPIPALRHSHTNEFLRDTGDDHSGTGSTVSAHPRPHKLNEKERKAAALPILIFGYPLVEKFYSKTYLDKEEGLSRLRSLLSPSSSPAHPSVPATSPNKTARAAVVLLQRVLRDKVFSVFGQGNEVVKVLFQEFMPDRVCSAEVSRCIEKLLPELLRACGDPAPRVHSTAMHTVLTVADCPHVRSLNLIPQQLVRPVAASMHPRQALSRLQMVEQLLQTHGIATDKNSGLTVRRLAECGAAGTQHASGAVRAAAERILLTAYQRSPRVVRAQLPPDDAVTRRNLIYRHLFQQFDKIDMQKILNNAPSEDPGPDNPDSAAESASVCQSTRSGISSFMTSSLGAGSLNSLKSSASHSTLAPSSLSGSFSSTRTRSSLKKPLRKYTPKKPEFGNIGYNKLRLDSATSPKHSPRTPGSTEKVHFEDTHQEVVLRRSNRNPENRHSMIHYNHENSKPRLKDRPITVYEPLHLEYQDPLVGGGSTNSIGGVHDLRSFDSLTIDSPRDLDFMDSPKRSEIDSPRLLARNIGEETSQMDESGYYSPGDGRRIVARRSGDFSEHFEGFEGGAEGSSEGTTPEPVCNATCPWCGVRVRGALEAHWRRRCVLHATCSHCRARVEARALHTHLLEECSMSSGAFRRCSRCGAALSINEGDYHVNCIPVAADEWKCPYCLHNVLARDLPWQRHLTQCPRNPRVAPRSHIA